MMESKIDSKHLIVWKEKPQEKRRRLLSLFLSLLLHVLLLLLSVKFFQPMGDLFQEEVRAVFIADEDPLLVPEYLYRPDRTRNRAGPSLSQETSEAMQREDVLPVSLGEVEEYLGSLYSRAETVEPADVHLDPEILKRFQLASPNESRFQLSISPEHENEAEKNERKPAPEKLFKGVLIPYAVSTNTKLSKLLASYSLSGTSSSTSGKNASTERADFNIRAWADRALAKIATNWDIDPLLIKSLKETVGISLTINRGGEIQSIEIVRSSGNSSLDSAALNALKASSPLPGLSENYPHLKLDLYFEFEYGH